MTTVHPPDYVPPLLDSIMLILSSNHSKAKAALEANVKAYCSIILRDDSADESSEPEQAPTPAALPVPKAPEPVVAVGETEQQDPLRAAIYQMSPAEQKVVRASLRKMIRSAVARMSDHDLQEVAQFIDIVANDEGCATPVEEFITDLVHHHYHFGGVTPEMVAEELDPENEDGFRYNFDAATRVLKRFQTMFPAGATRKD